MLRSWTLRLLLGDCRELDVRLNGRVLYTILHLDSGQWYGPSGVVLHRSSMHRWQNWCLHFKRTSLDVCCSQSGHGARVSNVAPILPWTLPRSRAAEAGLKRLKGTVHHFILQKNLSAPATFQLNLIQFHQTLTERGQGIRDYISMMFGCVDKVPAGRRSVFCTYQESQKQEGGRGFCSENLYSVFIYSWKNHLTFLS